MTGPTAEQMRIGECMRKRSFPCQHRAINWAWLLCSKHGTRSTVYRCSVCSGYHLTRNTAGTDAVVCVAYWPGPT